MREALLKARHFRNKLTGEGVIRSVESFRHATELDPMCAEAWAGLAQARATVGVLGLQPPHDVFGSARTATEHAIMLNDRTPEAQIALGEVYRFSDWDWPAAEASYRRAIALAPDHAAAHQFLGMLLSVLGRHEEAVIELARHGAVIEANLGYAHAHAGHADKARYILAGLTRRTAAHYVSPVDISLVLTGLGEPDAALTALGDGFRTRAARMLAVGDAFFADLLPEPGYRRLFADLRLLIPAAASVVRRPVAATSSDLHQADNPLRKAFPGVGVGDDQAHGD